MRSRTGALAARIAFHEAAAVYEALTDSARWREDCATLAALLPAGRVLDLGTGPGHAAAALARVAPASRVLGLDLSPSMLRRARRRLAAERVDVALTCGDAAALPFVDGAFDGVAGHSFLYLLADPAAALREVARVVRPGGRVAFLEPRDGAPDLRAAAAGGPRFLASMVLWRAMSALHRRFDEASGPALLAAAGLARARAVPALAGWGLVLCADRPWRSAGRGRRPR